MSKSTRNGWPCPSCGNKTGIVESRHAEYGVRRRRECRVCKDRFTTVETEVGDFGNAHKLGMTVFRAKQDHVDQILSRMAGLQIELEAIFNPNDELA